jgi:CMP-N,N'-diacetyllegionaminic acid synthase
VVFGKKLLAIVPARSGSKRLPRKNVREFHGKPLIAWSIEAGLASNYVDKVIVSTDDEEISRISKKYGADVPFLRPTELASDHVTTIDVVVHILKYFKSIDVMYDYVLLLQPTSPLRVTHHIDEALEKMIEKGAKGVISVCKVEHPLEWTNSLPGDGSMDSFIDRKHLNKRSQDLQERYRINGAIYVAKSSDLLKEKTFLLERGVIAYFMERNVSVDIDTEEDFILAECLKEMDKNKN